MTSVELLSPFKFLYFTTTVNYFYHSICWYKLQIYLYNHNTQAHWF